jgi:quinolinate synthase
MKKITLAKIERSLQTLTYAVEVEPETARRARRAVDRMLEIGRGEGR